MAEVLGKVEEFGIGEIGSTVLGVFTGGILHMIVESFLDTVLEKRYPEKYPTYSTAIATSIFSTIGIGGFIAAGRAKYYTWQYIMGGILLTEIVQFLDMIKVSFTLAAGG